MAYVGFLFRCYSDPWTLCQQFSLLFAIGAANRKCGARPESWREFLQQWQREKSLVSRYPITR